MASEKEVSGTETETQTGAEEASSGDLKEEVGALPEEIFHTKDFFRSRWSYTVECAFEYFTALMMSESFLAYILDAVGFKASTIGVLSSLISFSYVFQLLTVFVAGKIKDRKPFSIFFHAIGCFFFNALYLLPLAPFADGYRQLFAVIAILGGYFGNYFANAVLYQWGNSFVDPHKRGRFSSRKCMISLISGAAVQLGAGLICDKLTAPDGSMTAWFVFAAVGMLVFNVSDIVCLFIMRSDAKKSAEEKAIESGTEEKKSFANIFRHTFGNKKYRSAVYLTVLYYMAHYSVTGFLGVYRVQTLAFSATLIQLIAIGGVLVRFAVSPIVGRYTDRTTFARGVELGLVFALIGQIVLVVTAPGTRWLFLAYTAFNAVAAAAITQNIIDITYSYVDNRYFVEALAIKNVIAGLCGFVVALLSGKLFDVIDAAGGWAVFGVTLYPQQVQAAIAAVLFTVTILYNHFVVCRQKVMIQ